MDKFAAKKTNVDGLLRRVWVGAPGVIGRAAKKHPNAVSIAAGLAAPPLLLTGYMVSTGAAGRAHGLRHATVEHRKKGQLDRQNLLLEQLIRSQQQSGSGQGFGAPQRPDDWSY